MKCREFEEQVVDLARGRGSEEALAHAAECVRCAARLNEEREITSALRALAGATRNVEAPERVEAALVAAFGRSQPRRRVVPRWAFAAAAGVLAMAGVTAWLLTPHRIEVLPAVALTPPAPPPFALQRPPSPAPPVREAQRVMVRPKRPKTEIATQFYPLRFPVPPETETGPVLRVRVPRTTLVSFGLPINHDRAAEPVEADVMLDDTGIARAIRFVREP